LATLLWILIWIIAILVGLIAALAILGVNVDKGSLPSMDEPDKVVRMILDYVVLFIIILAFVIVSWISAFAIGVKRLHDRNKSGWWILLFYVVPLLLGGGGNQAESAVAGILGLVSLAISIWALIELGFLRGTVGPNRFGPDPLQRDAVTAPA